MGANRQTFLYAFPTTAAILRSVGRWHGYNSTASIYCFAFEDGPKLCPASITDALGQVRVPHHVGDLQVFEIDGIELAHQGKSSLMVEVLALPAHLLVLPGQELHSLPASFAAFFAAGDPAVRFLQFPLGLTIVTGIVGDLALGSDEEHFQADVYASLLAGWQQWVRGHIGARETAVPPVGFLGERDRLDRAFKGAAPSEGNAPDLGQDKAPVLKCGTVATLLIGETRVAVGALEAGIPWLRSCLHTAKERLEGAIQARQYVLQDLGVDVVVLRPHGLNGGQFSALMGAGDAHPTFLPGVTAFLERSVVEFPAATQNERHRLLLLLGREEFILEGLVDSRRIHTDSLAQMFFVGKANGPVTPCFQA